jgi:mannosyl-glycoprotein endo-beta-N-acetylglucosaminidase
MSVPPEFLAAGGIALTTISAAAYAYFSGNEASVDVDDDGNDDVTFGGDQTAADTDTAAVADDDAADSKGDTDEEAAGDEPQLPDYLDAYDGTTAINGIGPTYAKRLGQNHDISTPAEVYLATDEELMEAKGVGERTVEQIRDDIGSVESSEDDSAERDSEQSRKVEEQGNSSDESADSSTSEADESTAGEKSSGTETQQETGSGSEAGNPTDDDDKDDDTDEDDE